MTIYDLFLNIKDGADKLDSIAYPELKPEVLDRIVNFALDTFVRRIVTNAGSGGVEETQKKTDDIFNLIKYINITPGNEGFFRTDTIRTIEFQVPEDYWFSLSEVAVMSVLPCPSGVRIKKCYKDQIKKLPRVEEENTVKAETHNRIPTLISNPLYRPVVNNLYRVMANPEGIDTKTGVFVLFYDKDLIPVSYKLSYIKRLPEIKLDVTYSRDPNSPIYYRNVLYPMNEQCQREIINIAIGLIIEDIESERLKTFNPIRT